MVRFPSHVPSLRVRLHTGGVRRDVPAYLVTKGRTVRVSLYRLWVWRISRTEIIVVKKVTVVTIV